MPITINNNNPVTLPSSDAATESEFPNIGREAKIDNDTISLKNAPPKSHAVDLKLIKPINEKAVAVAILAIAVGLVLSCVGIPAGGAVINCAIAGLATLSAKDKLYENLSSSTSFTHDFAQEAINDELIQDALHDPVDNAFDP